MHWVSWLQLLAPFTGKWWIPEDHIPPRCYIPWCPTLQSHTLRSRLEHPTGLGLGVWLFCLGLGYFFSHRNLITSPTLSWMPFYCVCLQKKQHLIMCWEAACCLVNSEIIFRCILWAFFSLRKLTALCSKYPAIRYLWSPPHFASWKHKSPFCLLTLVGPKKWFEKELHVCSTAHQTDEGTFTKGGQGHHWACSHHLQALLNVSVLVRFSCLFL